MRGLLKLLAAIAAVAAVAPAHAQMRHRGTQDPRADFDRSSAQQQQAEPPRDFPLRQEFMQPGRLTPEERRQLRRDIHEAGRELYRREPPPRRPFP